MEKKKGIYFNDINIMRALATLFVLLGHSFPDAQTGMAKESVSYFMHSFLYNFHMPLFFLISGFLMKKYYENSTTVKEKNEFISKRFKRIIIPYIAYSVATMFLKVILSKYANNQFELNDFWKILIGENPNGGLWFLWVLFFASLFVIVFDFINIYIMLLISIVLLALLPLFQDGATGVIRVIKYLPYLYMGIILNKNYGKIVERVKRRSMFFISIVSYLVVFLYTLLDYENVLSDMVIACFGIIGTWGIANVIIDKVKKRNFLEAVSKYSLDIYLISYFVQVPIRIVAVNFISIPYIVTVILMFAGGLIVPILISRFIIRKNKVFKLVFLGT